MMTFINRRSHVATSLFAMAMTAVAALGFGQSAEARDIQITTIDLDLGTGEFSAELDLGPDQPPYQLQSAQEIKDGIFVKLDLQIKLTAEDRDKIEKMVDQGFTSEPSGCEPGAFGPLDMEDGLRYFFDIELQSAESVRATIYPGNRSTHWTNDVFCEFDPEAGENVAVFRLSGFYFVIHRNLREAVDIQLRPITLSPEEFEKYVQAE